jgi:hypothetical protein
MNIKIDEGGHNLRDKFQMNEPLRIYYSYGGVLKLCLLLCKIYK